MQTMSRPEIVLLVMMVSIRLAVDVFGQEMEVKTPREPSPAAHRFFDRPIDYWQRGLGFEEPKGEKRMPQGGRR